MTGPDPLLLGTAPKVEAPTVPRNPWVAALLALFCDGLGHFYCGNVVAAVFWAVLPLALVGALMAVGVFRPDWLPVIGVLALVALVGSRLLQAALAARLATTRKDFRPTRLNVLPMYFAFFLIAWAGTNAAARANRALVIEPFKIPSTSMAPTLLPGDQVFVLKAGPHAVIRRGDVVVHWVQDKAFIQRAVGLAGDTVELKNNALWINGEPVATQRCAEPTRTVVEPYGPRTADCWEEGGHAILADRAGRGRLPDFGPQTVPEGQLFMLGDWRDNSEDSRFMPLASTDAVIGRAVVIWLSLDEGWSIRWDRIGLRL